MITEQTKRILVTGSSGLIGSEVVRYFDKIGWQVFGIDNNMRRRFFGEEGDTLWNLNNLQSYCKNFTHHHADVRDRQMMQELVKKIKPVLVVHCAAQPSHDLAANIPYLDFETNAVGTLNMLEATRSNCPEAVFVHLSTNKVYGDRPNKIKLIELTTRYDFDDPMYSDGIDETMSIDQSKHSLFGASKVAADILVQEYGKYFGMKTCCLRGGCLTGPMHSGVKLHGFLSYLIRCNLEQREYIIFGYQGKQVRDNIHSLDVARCIHAFYQNPGSGLVFNLGGGRENSISILEAFEKISQLTGKRMRYQYLDKPREGDHICYISNLSRLKSSLPGWDITVSLDQIFEEIASGWLKRLNTP